jgi:2-hydroxycyclohexanecarboxyl-CoA dehydrogenase
MKDLAVITGAASGIGKAVAARLLSDGMAVALLDIDEARARATAADIAESGTALAYGVDVTDFERLQLVRDELLAAHGTPTVVVNCAGWSEIQPFLKNDQAFWKKAIDINLMGTITVTRIFLDDLIASGSGRVVNIASDAGRVGSGGEVVYAAAKGGVIAFTKSLAREMARHKISVNCVCPGPTETPMLMVQDQARIDALTKAIPMRRLAKPDDIAGAVAFFASPAAAYITGQVLSVSGGLTMAG